MNTIQLTLPGENYFPAEEAFKTLRTNIQFCGKDVHVIGVTGHGENDGKTLVTLHTARSLSQLGLRILVLDADMRNSVMAGRNTDAEAPQGLSEILSGLTTPDACIAKTQYEGLHILFAGKYPPNPSELLASASFADLLTQLRTSYDYILIDTPPLGLVVDAAVIAPLCDGMILVLANSRVRYTQLQNTAGQLRKSGCRILGVVCNNKQVRHHKKSRYYYPRPDKAGNKQ